VRFPPSGWQGEEKLKITRFKSDPRHIRLAAGVTKNTGKAETQKNRTEMFIPNLRGNAAKLTSLTKNQHSKPMKLINRKSRGFDMIKQIGTVHGRVGMRNQGAELMKQRPPLQIQAHERRDFTFWIDRVKQKE